MKILLTTIPSDSHMWNLVFMQLFLEEHGHEVINLGACVPIDLIIREAHYHRPGMIVVSSINGHGNIEGRELATAVKACDLLKNINLVIGGKLSTKGINNIDYVSTLKQAGFDEVYTEDSSIESFLTSIEEINRTIYQNA
ncbi:MAG: cobalamin B12-binding domain-containing protein [Gammaproteobacteria bacterium]